MRRFFLALAALLPATLLATPMAQAKTLPGPPESYLFVVDGSNITVTPGKDDAAKVVITTPSAIRFTDRPYRHQLPMSINEMLGEFAWDSHTHKLADATPNAAISIDGHSQIVDIRKAIKFPDRLVLSVRGIGHPVSAASGPGSVFIDNVLTYPTSQSIVLSSTMGLRFVVTLTSASTVVVKSFVKNEPWASVTLNDTTLSGTLNGPVVVSGSYSGNATYTAQATFTDSNVTVTLTRPGPGGSVVNAGTVTF